ncbi:MAG: flagellar basal body rod protein FlgB [Peptococcaceae bacterium]|jgi:flagellar basal-body rod protein FlgB|nr:flagellar basal body rod protein FlgB [Peptococcaceae bacterium]
MAGWMDSKIFSLLEGGLRGLDLRHKVLADNIANIDTPNFKRSDVNFEQILRSAMTGETGGLELKRTSDRHLPGLVLSNQFVQIDNTTTMRNDGNNVDIDLEMTRLAQNTLHYNALAGAYTSHLNMYKQVIQNN